MCKLNQMNWGLNRFNRIYLAEGSERAPDFAEKPKKIEVEVMPELDQAKANVEAAKAQAKLINAEKKAEALAKKEMLMSELARKGASGEAMNAFEASYDPRLRDTVSKIIENAKPAFNLHDPKSWEMIDAVLTDKKSGEFYSKVYEKEYFPLAPLIMPKKPKEPMRMEEVAIVGNVEKPERVSTAELNKAIDARLGAQLRKMREKLALKESVAKSVPKKQKPLMRMDEVAITGKVDKPATVARKGVDVSKSPVRRAEFPAEMMISRRPAKGVEEGIAAAMRIGAEKPNTGPSEEQLRKAGIDAISVWGTKLKSEGYPKSVISQAMKNEEILNDPEKSLYSALYDAFEGKQNIEKGVALYRKFMKEKATDEVAFEATKLALQGKPEKEAMALASRKVNGTPGKGFNTPSEEVAKK